MPQMAPLSWTLLMLLFTLLLVMSIIILSNQILISPANMGESSSPTVYKKEMNWKW